jgi:hypothetical protein
MKCFECNEDAQAICKFCGRAVCSVCAREARYHSGFSRKLSLFSVGQSAVIVENAIWCGKCKIHIKEFK